MITPYAMEAIKNRFYQYAVKTKNMKEVTDDRIEAIESVLANYRERFLDGDTKTGSMYKLERYYNALRYVDGRRDFTFDEKMIFVIKLVDPECKMYRLYRALDITTNSEIAAIEDKKEQAAAKLKQEITINEFQAAVRSELGFYEGKLIKFEEHYFKKFIKEFVDKCSKDYGNVFFSRERDFSKMIPAQYMRVRSIVSDYLTKVGTVDPKTVIFHVIYQNNLLKLYSVEEQLLFFILAVDPELDYLNIYDDECMWDKIEERIREEKEYFNKDLIFVEKDYCEAFGLENKRKNLW